MSNNRDDQYEGPDDSEYHFSDEDVNYEVESDTSKTPPVMSKEQDSGVSRLARSKRMLISLVVFLSLVYVFYKFVLSPTSTPPTEITPASVVAEQTTPKPVTAPQPAVTPAPVAAAPLANATPPVATTAPVTPQPPAIVVEQQPVATTVATLPAVIPVQSSAPAAGQSPLAAMGTYVEEKSAALSASSQQAVAQIQNQYTQQFNEFSAQNKSLQNQVQSLNARVLEMESQINQMVQILTRRNNSAENNTSNAPMNNPPPVAAVQSRSPEVRIAYNVQAIIPGRAWLKSENGETLTVAEGDTIRDVGRVTRIDPYDGVVEINTGTKAVSLSYGNG